MSAIAFFNTMYIFEIGYSFAVSNYIINFILRWKTNARSLKLNKYYSGGSTTEILITTCYLHLHRELRFFEMSVPLLEWKLSSVDSTFH